MKTRLPIRRKAFTLAEMLVVIGIIILLVAVGVPSIRSLMGSNSTSVARNELSSLITHAREEAIAIQDIRGVLFIVDPANDRITGIIVKPADLQDPNFSRANGVLLDSVPSGDSITLPAGIRIQTIFNGLNYNTNTVPQADDHYLGFNPPITSQSALIGGCILFDGSGRLVTRPYGLQWNTLPNSAGLPLPTTLANLVGVPINFGNYNTSVSGYGSAAPALSSAYVLGHFPATLPPLSQIGLVIFDYDTFKAQGFGDQDASPVNPALTPPIAYTAPQGPGGVTQSEQAEEAWIDANSTPVMINRFNGTLIRGE